MESLSKEPKVVNLKTIKPPTQKTQSDIVISHAAEPIKKIEDINRISEYLISKKRYRDNMLFILGINFGLRVSDLRLLRFSDIINENLTFKDTFPVFEIKTRNTRKRKKNRYITINNAVIQAVTLYLENTPNVKFDDYLFQNRAYNSGENQPLTRKSVHCILKDIAKDLNLNIQMSTHTLRKTFCYHQMMMSGNSQRKLLLLQKMLNHSSPAQTLDYIGITDDEMYEAYKGLNLGERDGKNYSILDSTLEESDVTVS